MTTAEATAERQVGKTLIVNPVSALYPGAALDTHDGKRQSAADTQTRNAR